jgi:hypothetical protein
MPSSPSRESTDALIARLARQAPAVQRIPPLRRALAYSGLTWLGTAAVFLALGPWWPSALVVVLERVEALLLCTGLAALGAGALLHGLAAAVPGREPAARLGSAAALAGGALIGCAALGGDFAPASARYQAYTLTWDAACFAFSVVGALPVAGVSLALSRQACALRPNATALGLALGSTALGAVLLQALCAEGSARHTVASHVLAPALAVPVLALVLLGALRRSRAGVPAQPDGQF